MSATRPLVLFLILAFWIPAITEARPPQRPPAYNEVSVDIPTDGGAMVMFSRMWTMGRYLDMGLVGGTGQIDRNFTVDVPGSSGLKAQTKATVFPFIGPRITANFQFVGVSLGYALYWAKTDLDVRDSNGDHLTGTTRGWGTGLYTPLVVFDFYDQKRDVVFGFGLGGFFGTSYPTLTASSATSRLSLKESPIDSITIHLQLLWSDGRWDRMRHEKEKQEDF